jgi:hypothetical protein
VDLISIPLAAYLLLIGLLWSPRQAQPPDLALADDPAQAERDYKQALRKQARNGLLRVGLAVLGAFLLLLGLLGGLGRIEAWGNFGVLLGLHSAMILFIQRSEVNRRLATMLILAPLTLIILPRYADYRGWQAESNWALYAALLLNYLFWWLIGQRYPVGSSEEIKVWGMDMQ